MLGGMPEDRVSCSCGSSFPGGYTDCGAAGTGDHLWRCNGCGSMYTEQSATGSGEIWASNEDDGLTDEESSRGLF